ncbi:hypothetical protein [Nocardia sp. NPDC057440]|uniref:hypothetical protein n=1 Tax=Nocardia sp. NPDC057440 TaxID=3346134 RepID=UPI00366B5C55
MFETVLLSETGERADRPLANLSRAAQLDASRARMATIPGRTAGGRTCWTRQTAVTSISGPITQTG